MTDQKEAPFRDPLKPDENGMLPLSWMEWLRDAPIRINERIAGPATDGTEDNFASFDDAGAIKDSGKAVPTGDVVGTTDTQTLTNKTLTDPVLSELAVDLPIEVDSNLIPINVFGHKMTIVSKSADYTVVAADLRKLLLFDCSVNEIQVTLPSVDSGDLGEWVMFGRTGTKALIVRAADSDTIMDSVAGGAVESFDTVHSFHRIGLRLLEATRWWFSPECFGVWATR